MGLTHYTVLAKGALLVPDYARMQATQKFCLVGRTVHTAPKVDALPPEVRCAPLRHRDATEHTGAPPFVEAWPAKQAPVQVPATGEAGSYYRERIAEGGLWPADKETAEACGVAFDPTFGGEYPAITAPVKTDKKSTKGD